MEDEIEVATITIDEETILEIKATMAFQLSLTTFVGHRMTATKLAKSALRVQMFFLFFSLIFSFPSS